MKKIFLAAVVLFLAVGCGNSKSVEVLPTPKPSAVITPTPNIAPTPAIPTKHTKTYQNKNFGFQFDYPGNNEISWYLVGKDNNIDSYITNMAGASTDSVIDALNKDLVPGQDGSIRVTIFKIKEAFPKNIAEACKMWNMYELKGNQCLNPGGDGGPGATQDFLFAERDALAQAEPGKDFNYFLEVPTQQASFEGQFHKTIGKVFSSQAHKIFAFAVPDQQAPQEDYQILTFDDSGNMIEIFYEPLTNLFGEKTDYKNLTASDLKMDPNWQTIQNIAQTFKFISQPTKSN